MMRAENTMRWIKLFALLSVAIFLLTALPRAAYAQNFVPTQVGSNTDALGVGGIGASTGLVDTDPRIIAAKIIRIALGLLGVIVIGFMLYAGYLWMTAGGDEEKVATAKKVLRNAVIGLAIILSSVAITQFIISKLTAAILGGAQKSGAGGGCVGEQCFTPEFTVFYATTTPQSPPQLPIKNVVVSIDFFNGLGAPALIDQATISVDGGKTILDNAITVVKQGTVDAQGAVTPLPADAQSEPFTGELKFVDQNTVEFHPVGSCADADNPANSSTNTDCFEKNTVYKVTLKNSIASKSGTALDCSTVHPCVSQFITGEKYDAEPPKISLVQPGNNALISNNTQTLVSAQVSDDAGVKKVAFYENETSNIVDKILNPFIVSGLVTDQTWKPKLSDPNKAEVVQLTAKAYDIDNHETLSSPQTVKILPAWCFNNTLDEDKGEEKASTIVGAPDCGQKSECGACQGEGCDNDLECAAGICIPQPGVKVSLTDQNTKYKAEGVGLPNPGKIIPYFEWYINGEPLTVAYLPFDKTSDTAKFTSNLSLPADALNVGQVSHATVAGPKWIATDGVIGGAYQFKNPGDYIETSVASWKGNQLSVEWWMKRAPGAVPPGLFMIAQIKDSFSIQTAGQNTVTVSAQASDTPGASLQEQGKWPLPPADNTWHQVTVVFDGSAIRYYIDGAQDPSSIPFAHVVNATNNSLVIGYKGNKGTAAFNGWIDEVRVFTRILNAQQLLADFKSITETQTPADTLDVNIAPAKALVTADVWQLSKSTYEITNTKALYREKIGICVNVPKITNVIQTSGAEDNYITVVGQSFGAYKPGASSVWFSKVQSPQAAKTDQWVNAELCNVKAWHDNYAVVKVPKSAVTGPIKIEAQSSVLPGYDGMVFRDTTADPFGPLFDPAEVFKITNEKLPGLCTVDPEKVIAGDIMKLTGTQLGNGAQASDAILLGTEDEPLNEFKEWSNFLISDIIMPATVATGVTSIKVKVNGKKSNALPLGILSSAEDTAPHIFSIDPAQGPVGTYVTFTGKNFGANGEILFSQGGDFFAADLPPAYCGATWTSNQIVVKVPQKIQNKGDYGVSVIIKKGAEETASNKKIFNVNTDPLKPGLCKLEPDNGPLFSAQFSGIEFKGEGFGDATPPGIVTFNKNAEVSDPKFFASWENTLVSAHKFLAIEKSAQAKFKTGPVSVANVQKLASNALQFKIQNCKEELQKGKELAVVCGEGNSCCASGVCEQKGQCPEDKKPGASVYMWSFTTGKLPVVPKVLEQCGKFCSVSGKPCTTTAAENEKKAKDECDKNILNDLCALVTPTPSPSAQWDNQTGICVNASVKIRFDTLVDISANNAPQMVVLYQCQDKKKCSLADEKQIVGVSYALGAWSAAGKEGTMVGLNSVSDLLPDTQYGILVTTAVKSFAGALSEFMPENPACAAPDKGVIIGGAKGLKAAYCATFTTRATKDYCELGAVVVDPSYYVTSEFNQKSANLYSATPIAKGNLCVALNGDGYNWAWSPTNTPSNKFQEPSAYADISNNAGKNNAIAPVQDLTTKDKETPFGNPEKIIATWIDPLLNAVGAIKGIGQLTIKLPNPKMVSYYPQCTTACVNAQVGAEFNVELAPESVNQQTVLLYKCAQFDVTCKQYVTVDSNLYQVQIVNLQAKEGNLGDTMSITHDPFAPNTYYKVVVQGGAQGIKSKWNIAMDKKSLNENCAPDGSSCASFAWVFRTKDTGAACAVDKVSLVPQQATVKVVGAQASFEALAIGSPDACNPNGQILDTSGKSYAWSFAPPENPTPPVLDPKTDRAVVWMSNFASGKQEFPWCTASCVKAGSASAPEAGLCGNNKVESGEECDPSVGGGDNTPEKCGWNCLFIEPKSKGTPVCTAATIAQGGCCGNGPQVLPEAGEECDIGLLNGVPGSGCSDVCLKEGTSVSYATCIDKNKVKGNPYECAHGTVNFVFGNGDAIPYKNIVVKAQSVCGNGVEEQGEACDLGAKNGMENSYCSKSCVLSLVPSDGDCGNGIVTKTMGEECDPKAFGSESIGCSNTCKKLGASPIYGSWCGDGVVGAGESCDTAPQGLSAQVSATQYATAVGMGTVKDKKQTATVSATISQAGQPSKTGAGQFILQCGFSPQNSACPNANDPGNATNGVGADSCCYKRPTVAITQPPQPITSNVCPNAVFEVVMKDGKVDDATIPGNIIFAEEIKVDDNAASCPNGSQPFAYAEKIPPSRGWWQSLIASLKKIFGLPAYADKFMYCGGTSVSFKTAYNEKANVSTITITPSAALKKNANYRLLVLNYDKNKGWGGLKDMQGLTFVNQYGQLVAVEHSFTTADVEYCKVSKVAVEPAYHLFTKKNEVQTFGVKIYFAPQGVAIDNNAQEIAQVPGQYAWDYIWNTSDTTVVNVDANALTKTVEAKAVGKNGMVTLTGGVKITQDGTLPSAKNTEITGEATAQVFLCENPWPGETVYADTNQPQKLYGVGLIDAKTSPAETVSGGNLQQGTAWNNFQTLYCKDAGKSGFEDDLPALKLPAVLYHNSPPAPAPADPILKEFFFTFEDTSKNTDSIGLRVYPNTDHKTLSEWYQSQPWIPKGNPVPAKVGAYEALQEGRTFYIAGMNIDTNTGEDFYVSYDAQSGFMFAEQGAGGGFKFVPLTQYGKDSTSFTYDLVAQKVTYKNHTFVHYGNFSEVFHIVIPPKMIGYTNVYVWSLSDNASAETIAVFNQLLANFTLNINIDNPRVCSNDSNSSCSKDLDCGAAGGVCVAPLDKATRDLKRIKDLAKLANKIELYNELNASYPNLKNNPSLGTFIPGYTNSKWLSWQGVLGNALTIALPSDPINVFNGCGGGDVNATQITSGGPTYYLKDFDAQTCWNAQNSTFACPQGSYVYQYEFSSKTKAVVKADFELPSVDWKKSLIDVVGNKATIATGNTCADQVIGLSEKCGDGVVGPGEDCEIGQMDEKVCPFPVGPFINVGKNSYSATQFVPCTDTCTWSANALPLSKLKLCNHNSNQDAPIACAKDADCAAVVPVNGSTSTCQSELHFCAVTGKLCVTNKDCNKADAQDVCLSSNVPGLTCVPHGYCGNGKMEGTEVCDDGANNGKYGYCSFGCTTKGGGGFCGDGKFDIKNEICDASALNYHELESDKITPFWSYETGGAVTTSIGNGTQASWRDNNNLVACADSSYQDGCVLSGAKYNPDKLMSCSWDCQSFDYCGDGKVNTTLKSDGKPYEECEKSETCQVGYCTYKNGTKFIKNNVGVLCENNVDCAPKALNIALSFCDNNYKCSTYSSNAGDACTKNEDCVQNFICQDFEVGKRYCNMKSEFQPKLNVTAFGDDTAKFVSNACVWKSETVGVAIVTCLPLSAPPVQANAGVCGDGIIQDGKKGADGKLMPGHGELAPGAVPEVCDKGNDNGSIPIVEYGKTANYCAFGCGQVITVSGGFCGDKNVSGPEYCDASAASDDYVCRGTSTACNPKDSSPCSGSTKCVPSARWSEGAKNSCDATKQESTVPNGSFLTNCTNTCIGSCKVPVCGDKVVDPGEECDKGDPQTFKDGANGVVPVLAYNNSKKTQNYCDASCKNATVSNEYCGDEKLTSTEDCDTVNALSAFSDAATGKCSSSTVPQCDTTSCTSKCVSPPINDVNLLGVQGTSLIVEVVDQNGVYSPESLSDASDKLEVQWNGRTKYTLDNSNKFRIKFLNLIASPSGGSDGKITVTPVNNGSDFRYVALYAVPVNPSESSMSTNPNVWSWGGSTPVTEGVYISFTDPIDVVIKTKNP